MGSLKKGLSRPDYTAEKLLEKGIKISAGEQMRFVLHKDVSSADCKRVVEAFKAVLSE